MIWDFLKVVSGSLSIIIAGLILTYKLWSPMFLQYVFDRRIIKYKTDLETEKEKQLAEFSKSITGFNMFFDKKYEIYPILYSKVLKLHGELSSWEPMQFYPDLSDLTNEEFSGYLDTFGFSKPDKRKLMDKKETGEITTNDISERLHDHFEFNIGRTNNYFLENQLFISNEVEKLFKEFRDNAVIVRSGYNSVFNSHKKIDKWDVIKETNESNSKILEDMLNQMRRELQQST